MQMRRAKKGVNQKFTLISNGLFLLRSTARRTPWQLASSCWLARLNVLPLCFTKTNANSDLCGGRQLNKLRAPHNWNHGINTALIAISTLCARTYIVIL